MIIRIIKLIISLIWAFYKFVYLIFLELTKGKKEQNGVILLYHNVTVNQRTRFAKQMDILLRYAVPVKSDFVHDSYSDKNYVAVTFDDGYDSIFDNAIPETNKRNIPITVFIQTGYLGDYPGWYKDKNPKKNYNIIIEANRLRDISQNNLISIGSHTINHRNLIQAGYEERKDEIFNSKKILEELLDKKITLLSLPHGEYDLSIIKLCKQAGYHFVFSILPLNVEYRTNEYLRGRVNVEPSDWYIEFRLKLMGAYLWQPKAFYLKSKVKNLLKNRNNI